MLIRTLHHLVYTPHALLIYVDDILAALDAGTTPMASSLIIVMCLCLCIPMSWSKAHLGPGSLDWLEHQFPSLDNYVDRGQTDQNLDTDQGRHAIA
jgi:hypothetical protein